MNNLNFLEISFVDIIDILLVSFLLYYVYKLVKGTIAINIFLGIVIIYIVWKLTLALNMDLFSTILGKFISGGFFALIVVFQNEIRKFLLLVGSSNYTSKKNLLRYFKINSENKSTETNLDILLQSCKKMSEEKIGALIVLERVSPLEFTKKTSDKTYIQLSPQILETIFCKNSPLHDGAVILKDNVITATRVILPISNSNAISKNYGLRHRSGIGISEETDAIVLIVSEETGEISYIKEGHFIKYDSLNDLKKILSKSL